MARLRMGIIGIGNMGSAHAKAIFEGKIPEMELVAVADRKPSRREWAAQNFGDGVRLFKEGSTLIDSEVCDAVLIATPHYQHPSLRYAPCKRESTCCWRSPPGFTPYR